MTSLSIKIKILDRIYPMQVEAEDEATVRYASRLLEERLRTYQRKFNIQDQQDLLSMVAFDCLVDNLQQAEKQHVENHLLTKKLSDWQHAITTVLNTKA